VDSVVTVAVNFRGVPGGNGGVQFGLVGDFFVHGGL
jgi:hypothetical protein